MRAALRGSKRLWHIVGSFESESTVSSDRTCSSKKPNRSPFSCWCQFPHALYGCSIRDPHHRSLASRTPSGVSLGGVLALRHINAVRHLDPDRSELETVVANGKLCTSAMPEVPGELLTGAAIARQLGADELNQTTQRRAMRDRVCPDDEVT